MYKYKKNLREFMKSRSNSGNKAKKQKFEIKTGIKNNIEFTEDGF